MSYPESYSIGLPTIEMEEYERTREQIVEILHELGKGDASFCRGLGDMLEESDLQNKNMFGFLYKLGDDRKLVGLALFYSDYVGEDESIKIGGKEYKSGTKMIRGEIRCSAVKGIGRSIQGDIEDFARHNTIPLIQIQASSPQQKKNYYIPKLGYENIGNSNSIYKIVKGGGKPRKNRRTRKVKRK
jgi:hypothetical protein